MSARPAPRRSVDIPAAPLLAEPAQLCPAPDVIYDAGHDDRGQDHAGDDEKPHAATP